MAKSQTRSVNGTKKTPVAKAKAGDTNVDLAQPQLLKQLVNNDEEVRAKAFEAVKQLLKTKRAVSEEDLQKLWKGLWYTMWHSDTPLVQQAFAQDLASLFDGVVAPKNFPAFVDAFWVILVKEWSSLDKWRINKFYLLVRFVLGALLARIAKSGFDAREITNFEAMMTASENGPLSYGNAKTPHSLRLHLIDIYVDELAKAFGEDAPEKMVVEALLKPVTSQLEFSEFKHVKQRVAENVMDDERLVEWGIVEPKVDAVEEDDDSEFEGFD